MSELLKEKIQHMFLAAGTGIIKTRDGGQVLIKATTLRLSSDRRKYHAKKEDGEEITIPCNQIKDAYPHP